MSSRKHIEVLASLKDESDMIILDSNYTNIEGNGYAENRKDVTFKKILRLARHYFH